MSAGPVKPGPLSEREFVETMVAAERKLQPLGFVAYDQGMRNLVAELQARAIESSIKVETTRRMLERIFEFACMSLVSAGVVVSLLAEFESVAFKHLDRRVSITALLGLWLERTTVADRAVIGPSEKFIATTEALLTKSRPSRLKSECEPAVKVARTQLEKYRTRSISRPS